MAKLVERRGYSGIATLPSLGEASCEEKILLRIGATVLGVAVTEVAVETTVGFPIPGRETLIDWLLLACS